MGKDISTRGALLARLCLNRCAGAGTCEWPHPLDMHFQTCCGGWLPHYKAHGPLNGTCRANLINQLPPVAAAPSLLVAITWNEIGHGVVAGCAFEDIKT
ncbi:Hypothetical protein NTJ_04165 [Nesidiocoris tenuis]|uniref:Uncharacterized protein n=1 Tax=Nesidiocoris tenuis TaxID=355587 RepID=A0ABN7ALY5_9HEMI|nr:Hypothetical protein NTJ_04165 [Nesidiocoris tenuis]